MASAMADPVRMIEPGATVFSAAEIRVVRPVVTQTSTRFLLRATVAGA